MKSFLQTYMYRDWLNITENSAVSAQTPPYKGGVLARTALFFLATVVAYGGERAYKYLGVKLLCGRPTSLWSPILTHNPVPHPTTKMSTNNECRRKSSPEIMRLTISALFEIVDHSKGAPGIIPFLLFGGNVYEFSCEIPNILFIFFIPIRALLSESALIENIQYRL